MVDCCVVNIVKKICVNCVANTDICHVCWGYFFYMVYLQLHTIVSVLLLPRPIEQSLLMVRLMKGVKHRGVDFIGMLDINLRNSESQR